MLTIDPQEISTSSMHSFLLGAVVPRPIAFVSTIDVAGNVNLSPFSFFNAFGSNPPVLVFSPSRRARDNTIKHTLENVSEHPEVVINMVDFPMVEQMSLASTEYDKGVNEFIKAGLKMRESGRVKPPRVAESPAAFECKVIDVISLGKEGGAGNLVVCEVILAHFHERILDGSGKIDPNRFEAVARLGGNWYTRVSKGSLFEIMKPIKSKGIGVDRIPERIRNSKVLSGNDLGKLGNVEDLPSEEDVVEYGKLMEIQELREKYKRDKDIFMEHLHQKASKLLSQGQVEEAWKVLLQDSY